MKTHPRMTQDRTTHQALRQIPYGLYVLGVRGRGNGDMNAMAASWVTQCSFDPPLLMVAVRKPSRTYDLIKSGRRFALNLLDKKERKTIRTLEKPFRAVGNKIDKVSHVEEDTGAPILRQAFAYLECKVREIYQPGDHALVVGLRGAGVAMMCSDLKWLFGG